MNREVVSQAKAVLFDWDDTLVATLEVKIDQIIHVGKKYYNLKITREDVLKHYGISVSALLKELYGDIDFDEVMAHNIAEHDNFPKVLHDDTLETLNTLKKAGKKIGVITAINMDIINRDFKRLGISPDLFDYIQTEEDTKFHKPDPRVFDPTIKWLKSHGINPEEVVYVGDSLKDMEAALGAGFEFIGIETGTVTQKEFKKSGAKSTVNKLGGLAQG